MTFAVEHNAATANLILTHALMFHQETGSEPYSTGMAAVYITSHAIHSTNNGPRVGAGHALSLSDQEALCEILMRNTQSKSLLLPANVLAAGASCLTWYVAGKSRVMYVQIGKRLQRWTVPWPTLVFKVTPKGIGVAALSSDKRPDGDTLLFHAPLANVYNDGRVCTGGAVLPPEYGVGAMPQWETVIFNTGFSHVNHEFTLRLAGKKKDDPVSDGDHFSFWKNLAKAKHKAFPVKMLVPMNVSLEEWLR